MMRRNSLCFLKTAVCCFVLLLLSVHLIAQPKRFSVATFGGVSVNSIATYQSIGITSDYGGKYYGGLKLGFDFISRNKIKIGLDLGAIYRDYGFRENSSTIPYWNGSAGLHFRRRVLGRLGILIYGAGEYGRLWERRYQYLDTVNGNKTYNVFLHRNDALALTYGGGISFRMKKAGIDLASEKCIQVDTYDGQYGRTIGGRFLFLSLNFYI